MDDAVGLFLKEKLAHQGFVSVAIASLPRLRKCRWPQCPVTLPRGESQRRDNQAGRGALHRPLGQIGRGWKELSDKALPARSSRP
jgi:hypothetical protein